jgi:hypothetical protein
MGPAACGGFLSETAAGVRPRYLLPPTRESSKNLDRGAPNPRVSSPPQSPFLLFPNGLAAASPSPSTSRAARGRRPRAAAVTPQQLLPCIGRSWAEDLGRAMRSRAPLRRAPGSAGRRQSRSTTPSQVRPPSVLFLFSFLGRSLVFP